MSAFLQINEAGSVRDVAILPQGKPLTIGRGEQNDVSVPTDQQMSSQHATLSLKGTKCTLKDSGSTNGTWLNDKQVTTVEVTGPIAFRCGMTQFQLDWQFHSPTASSRHSALRAAAKKAAAAAVASEALPPHRVETPASQEEVFDLDLTTGFCGSTALDIVQRFSLTDQIDVTPEVDEGPSDFVARLRSEGDDVAAIRFLAFALPRRCSVWWLIRSLQNDFQLDDRAQEVLRLCELWVKNPTRHTRLQPAKFADRHKVKGLSRWVADAVFHSHGQSCGG